MSNNFKQQSWFVVLLLSLITFGIYIPFWFKKIKKATDNFPKSALLLNLLLIISFVVPFLSINITTTVNEVASVFSTNFYGIGTILSILRAILIIFLSFNLKTILEKQYNSKLNPILVFFLGPLYLQYKINLFIEKKQSN